MNRRSLTHRVIPTLLLAVMAASLFACATNATAERKAFTTLDDVATAVNQGMKAFNESYQNGGQSEEQRAKVLVAYADYQKGFHIAEDAARAGAAGVDPLQIARDAAGPLLTLLASFKR